MTILVGKSKVECVLRETWPGAGPELVPAGGEVSFPPPGAGLVLLDATEEEREALRRAGFRLPEAARRAESMN